MHVRIETPSLDAPTGNARTAGRWQTILTELGHTVTVTRGSIDEEADMLVAIHAGKSASAVQTFRSVHPSRPVVLLLSGTDLYGDLRHDATMNRSLSIADRLVVLHERGADAVPAEHRSRVRWIPQSITPPAKVRPRPTDHCRVVVASNLRDVKDPLRTLAALDYLPTSSTIAVVHVGAPLDAEIHRAATRASEEHPRYSYLGAATPEDTLQHIASSHLLSLTSKLEGGANVLSEAIVLRTPSVCSHIDSSVGILGEEYEGFFPQGDSRALAELMHRAATDATFYSRLLAGCEARRAQFRPEVERRAWAALLKEL